MDRCFLFCYAPPDDESFSGGGTAMAYAAAGVKSVLVTATRGERGKAGNPPVCAPDDLAACRERELHEAARIIGFDAVHLLDYRDRELAEAPPDEIRQSLVALIRRYRPSVVATFDTNGFNRRFTLDAAVAAADSRWFPDAGPAHTVPRIVWTPPIAAWEAGSVDRLDERAGADFVVDVSRWRDRREAALRAHRSQHQSIDRLFFSQPDLDRVLRLEAWRQAWGPPLTRRPSPDLLEGL